MKIELDVPPSLYADLQALTFELGAADAMELALEAIAQWVAARKAEIANRNPSERYFVNEALDQLLERQKKSD